MLLPRIDRPISKATDVGSLKVISSYGSGVVTDSDGTMVTIITEKLRTQTLDDNVQFAPISQLQTRRSWDLAPTRGSTRICHIKGEKDWSQYVQSTDHYRQQQSATSTTTDELSHTPAAALPFPPTGPAVYSSGDYRSHFQPSTPQKAAPPPAIATQLPPLTTASVTSTTHQMMVVGRGIGHGGEGGTTTTSVSSKTPPLMCFYNKSLASSGQSEFIPGTPPDPPKKRHCRSLSIPGDVKTIKCSSKSSKWQPQASSIWKPVALRPHRSHSNNGKAHHHSSSGSSSVLIKTNTTRNNNNSPISFHSKPPKLLSTTDSSQNSLAIGNNTPLGKLSGGAVNQNITSSFSASSATIHQNFSQTVHVFTGGNNDVVSHIVTTPPESPAPRPASASSGFYDSSASQTSLTSLNVSWTEGYFNSQGCFSPHPPAIPRRSTSAASSGVAGSQGYGGFARRSGGNDKLRWERSLSVEEPISYGNTESFSEDTLRGNDKNHEVSPQTMSSLSSLRNRRNHGFESSSPRATRSMPVINLSVNSTPRATPWSPRRHRVPRCRSQPCVLTERKAGLKRRRDEERPSLNFKKMAETAYPPSVHHNRPKSVTFAQDFQEFQSGRCGLHTELDTYHVLDPIASSPLDPPQAFAQMAAAAVPQSSQGYGKMTASHGGVANAYTTLSKPALIIPQMAHHQPQGNATLKVPTGAFRRNNTEGISTTGVGFRTFGEKSAPLGGGVIDDTIQWDSGCSDTNDPPDLISFSESSENSYSFNDDPNTIDTNVVENLEESQQFELEMGSELDLDQIEKD